MDRNGDFKKAFLINRGNLGGFRVIELSYHLPTSLGVDRLSKKLIWVASAVYTFPSNCNFVKSFFELILIIKSKSNVSLLLAVFFRDIIILNNAVKF